MTTTAHLQRSLPRAAAVLLTAGSLLSACGSSTTNTTAAGSSSATTSASNVSAKPAYCSDFASLQQSVKALADVRVVKNGTQALQSALTQVKDAASALAQSTQSEVSAQAQQIESAVDKVSASAKDLKDSPNKAELTQLKADLAGVQSAVKNSPASAKCG